MLTIAKIFTTTIMIDNDRLIEIVDNTDTGTCDPHQIKNHHHHDHGTA